MWPEGLFTPSKSESESKDDQKRGTGQVEIKHQCCQECPTHINV